MCATVCEVCAEGRAVMDAVNAIGREGAASLAPALEKMPQLTSLNLYGARIRFLARRSGGLGDGSLDACCWESLRCDVLWLIAWMRCAVLGVRA